MMIFETENAFLEWMSSHYNERGVWIKFDKTRTNIQLTPEQALDIALCYGWIDGLLKKVDEQYYIKYFSPRRPKSIWSTKNKKSVERLINTNKMTKHGLKVINIAKKNGTWDKADHLPDDFSMQAFEKLIQEDDYAFENYCKMSASIKKTYAIFYFTAKKEETRQKRLKEIICKLRLNLKPMDAIPSS